LEFKKNAIRSWKPAKFAHFSQHIRAGASLVEILVRLGFALLLSLCLALLFAWGWDHSDAPPDTGNPQRLSTTSLAPLR
jgi:hypothetical protein